MDLVFHEVEFPSVWPGHVVSNALKIRLYTIILEDRLVCAALRFATQVAAELNDHQLTFSTGRNCLLSVAVSGGSSRVNPGHTGR